MKQFLFSKKFWAPWVILLIVLVMMELSSRAGWFDAMVSTRTYLGKALVRAEALEAYGHDNVEVISLGDSRLDWGLDHGRFRRALKQNNDQNYIRLTLEMAGFLAIQTTAEWALENLPNLNEVILGFDGTKSEPRDKKKQMMISLPFSEYVNEQAYSYHFSQDENLIDAILNSFRLSFYYHEIKNWLRSPATVISTRSKYFNNKHPQIWDYKHNILRNLCSYQLDSVAACKQTAQRLKAAPGRLKVFEKRLVKSCTTNYANLLASESYKGRILSDKNKENWKNNWLKLFQKFSDKKVKLTLVLLPETEISQLLLAPVNADEFINELVDEIAKDDNIQVIDLRKTFDEHNIIECEVYGDFHHFNNEGIEHVTNELIESLTND